MLKVQVQVIKVFFAQKCNVSAGKTCFGGSGIPSSEDDDEEGDDPGFGEYIGDDGLSERGGSGGFDGGS
jgi:hypothetical protein